MPKPSRRIERIQEARAAIEEEKKLLLEDMREAGKERRAVRLRHKREQAALDVKAAELILRARAVQIPSVQIEKAIGVSRPSTYVLIDRGLAEQRRLRAEAKAQAQEPSTNSS